MGMGWEWEVITLLTSRTIRSAYSNKVCTNETTFTQSTVPLLTAYTAMPSSSYRATTSKYIDLEYLKREKTCTNNMHVHFRKRKTVQHFFSTDGLTLVRGTLEDVLYHRKPTTLSALREEPTMHTHQPSDPGNPAAAHSTDKCLEAPGLHLSASCNCGGWR